MKKLVSLLLAVMMLLGSVSASVRTSMDEKVSFIK